VVRTSRIEREGVPRKLDGRLIATRGPPAERHIEDSRREAELDEDRIDGRDKGAGRGSPGGRQS
jgi:hypothetical protein